MFHAAATARLLSDTQIADFNRDGFLLLPGFYDLDTEIRPIQVSIHKIIGMMLKNHRIPFEQPAFRPATFDSGYQELIAKGRSHGSVVYDAVKHIPAFVRLASLVKHDQLMMELRNTDMPGVPSGGYGIRIDNPFEEKFRANWHQDYPYQRCSLDGLVYWSPLVPITPDIGPLQIAVGSHRQGLRALSAKEMGSKPGAYAYRLHNEEQVLASYTIVHKLMNPGDLLVIDYQTLHASGYNSAKRSRWSMQLRYFNYREVTGQSHGWAGAVAAGYDMRLIHPDLFVE
jgi:hypothetical protein